MDESSFRLMNQGAEFWELSGHLSENMSVMTADLKKGTETHCLKLKPACFSDFH